MSNERHRMVLQHELNGITIRMLADALVVVLAKT